MKASDLAGSLDELAGPSSWAMAALTELLAACIADKHMPTLQDMLKVGTVCAVPSIVIAADMCWPKGYALQVGHMHQCWHASLWRLLVPACSSSLLSNIMVQSRH